MAAVASTHQTYKPGTTKIATWLVQNAERCGISVSGNAVAQTNGVAPKKSKKTKSTAASTTTKYKIKLNDFVSFAEAIAASEDPKIRLPKHIVALIRSVITLRKQATAFFLELAKTSRSAALDRANAGHRHFVTVLDTVLTILQPVEVAESSTAEVTNLFDALTVEDTVAEDEPSTDSNTSTTATTKTAEYELESSSEDNLFLIFSLFKDVNEVRDYVKGVWRYYRNGRLDLMSAAVTTDTAITLLKSACEETVETIPGHPNYPGMLSVLTTYIDQFGYPSDDTFGDWTCVQTANLLNSYEDVLDPSSVPVMKPGHFGIYDPHADRSRMSSGEKHREDLIVLLELLPEFTKLSRTSMYLPAQDELTTGLRKMMDANAMDALPMHCIFGTQILLDIHHVLREKTDTPFMSLQATGKRVITFIDDYFNTAVADISNWPEQNDEVFTQMQKFAKEWTQEDRVGKAIVKGVGNVRPRPYHLLRNHPVLCGLLEFRLQVLLNDGGINLCNAWGTVMYPAHLYNAARQSRGLEEKWHDMEYLLSVHSSQRIFVGAAPTDPPEYLRRFLLALGTSASAFARNRRPGGSVLIPESRRGPRGLKTTSPVKDIFRNRYLYEGPLALTTPNIIAILAVASKAERTSWASVDAMEFARKMAVWKDFSTIQLLTAVREGVAGEEMHLKFDYFALHQRCSKLLRTLQTHLHGDMVRYFGENYIEDESQLPFIIGYLFEVVAGSNRVAQDLRLANTGSAVLQKASDVLATFLEGVKSEGIKSKAVSMTDCIVHTYHDGQLKTRYLQKQ